MGIYTAKELTELGVFATEKVGTECFPAFTPIALSSGARPISGIRVGDMVLAFDREAENGRGALAPRRVTRLYGNFAKEFIELNWIDPVSGEARTLTATPGHVMLTTEGTYRQLGEMVTGGRKTEDGRRKGEMVVSPSHLRGSEGRAVARPGRGGGRERQRAISDSFTPTPMLRIDPPHKGEGKVPRTGVPLAKGQRFGVPIGTVELVADTGAVVLAQAYLLQYSAATADLFEQAG